MGKRLLSGAVLLLAALLSGCGDGHGTLHRHFKIPSPAMAPTIKVGTVVDADLGAYLHHPPQRGDIVIFSPPVGASSQTCGVPSEPTDGHPCERPTPAADPKVKFIKRIEGLPGDWLYVQDNRTYIGTRRSGPYVPQKEPFIPPDTPCDFLCNLRKPIRVPPGHYFMMGDNRGESDDSRDWGPVPRSSLIGKVAIGSG
jgi:signal peptidase I